MKEELIKTIEILKHFNSFLDQQISEEHFDEQKIIINKFSITKVKVNKLLKELDQAPIENREKVNELLILLHVEYTKLAWCFEEMDELIIKLIKIFPT